MVFNNICARDLCCCSYQTPFYFVLLLHFKWYTTSGTLNDKINKWAQLWLFRSPFLTLLCIPENQEKEWGSQISHIQNTFLECSVVPDCCTLEQSLISLPEVMPTVKCFPWVRSAGDPAGVISESLCLKPLYASTAFAITKCSQP